MTNEQKCFDHTQFNRFLESESDAVEESRILAHIATCKTCQSTLEALAGHEQVWGEIREHLAENDVHIAGAETRESIDGLDQNRELKKLQQLLGPTDNPDMLGRIGSYEVCGLIGRGSAGLVVKALDTQLNRNVAIKLLAPVYSNNGSSRRRFEREGRAIASVRDPNVIPVHTVGEYQGTPYIVMQYVPDGSLQQRIDKSGPLTTAEVVCVGMQIAKGLSAAHKRGIVHRDVKPANVLLESGVDCAMVTDFGLARVVDEATMTRSGAISGTPQFMSPEQAKGESVDPRSDLFSLGSVMYAACTGRSPFRAETVFGVIKRVCETEPRSIRETNPEVAEWLTGFIAKLHAKDINDRFDSADQVAELLSLELAHLQSPTMVAKPNRDWMPKPIPRTSAMKKPQTASDSNLPFWIGSGVALLLAAAIAFGYSDWNGTGAGAKQAGLFGFGSTLSSFVSNTQDLEKYKNRVETTIDVQDGGKLFFHSDMGTLNVETHDKETVEMSLVYTVKAENEEIANRLFKAMNINYDVDSELAQKAGVNSGSDASIVAMFGTRKMTPDEIKQIEDPEELRELLLIREYTHSRDAKFELLIPEDFSIDLTTFGGAIETEDIGGDVNVLTHGGHIEIGDVTGTVNVKTHGGHIEAGNVGDEASFRTHGGHIEFGSVDGKTLAHTHGGHIEGMRITGPIDAKTFGGHVKLFHTADSVIAKTSGGGVTILKAEGPVKAESPSGSIKVTFVSQPDGDSSLLTKTGNVHVGYAEGLAFDIQAKTKNGRVVAPFSEKKTKKLNHKLNDGDHKLNIVTSNGAIKFHVVNSEDVDEQVEARLAEEDAEDEANQAERAFNRGYDLIGEGKYDESIAANLEAAKFEGKRGIATYNIGCALALKGDKDAAFEALNSAITFGFNDSRQFQRDEDLDTLRDDERFDELMTRMQQQQEEGEKEEEFADSIRKLLSKAKNELNGEEYEVAEKLYRKIIEWQPENIHAHFNLGLALHFQGQLDEAYALHQRSAETDQYKGLGNYNMACVHSLKNEADDAIKFLEIAIENGFDDPQYMQDDSDLDNIREDERFVELMVGSDAGKCQCGNDDCDCKCADGGCECECEDSECDNCDESEEENEEGNESDLDFENEEDKDDEDDTTLKTV